MTSFLAYIYKLRPTGEQEQLFRKFAGCARFIYNKALTERTAHYEKTGKGHSYRDQAKHLTQWRHDPKTTWLGEVPYQFQQSQLAFLELAFQRFFKKITEFPKFKKRGQDDSFSYVPYDVHVDRFNPRIRIPKVGWVRFWENRPVPKTATITQVTVSSYCGDWYVSVSIKQEVDEPKHPTPNKCIGIDVGITRFATFSDGTFIEPLNAFRKQELRLAKAQRKVSRKQKGSNNRRKAQFKVAKIHRKIVRQRNDYLHKASTMICKNHAIICIEDLRVSNMSRSASGTIEKPGKNVTAKSGLNKSILDQGWGYFRRMLEYKALWNGCTLVAVPPNHTSQTCPIPSCQNVDPLNRTSQSEFKCTKCGYEDNADHVGALNVLTRGLDQVGLVLEKGRTDLVSLPSEGCSRTSATGTHRSDLVSPSSTVEMAYAN
jgi:putative transposase